MKNQVTFCSIALLLSSCINASWFAYDRAAVSAQKEDWHTAKTQLQQLVVEQPDNPQLLYDLGVAAYKSEEYVQAAEYAQEAANKAVDQRLKEQAHFNQGNSLVKLKKLEEAIDAYNKVLEINPQNEPALNNKERVKRKLEEEQQKNQQQQQDKKQDQQQQEKRDDQQQQDQSSNQDDQKKDDQNEQSGDDNQQQQKQEKQSGKGNEDQDKEGDNSEQQGSESQDRNKQQQRDANKEKEQKEKGKERDRQEKAGQDDKSQEETGKDARNKPEQNNGRDKMNEQDVDHTQTPQENKQQMPQKQDTQELQKEQAGAIAQAEADMFKELDARLAQILEKQEEKDAQMSKQIIKMQVNKQLAGQDGQNRW